MNKSLLLKHILFQHGEVLLLAEDEVIKHLDTQELSGLAEASGDISIFRRGGEIATGVVVSDDDRRCSTTDCVSKYFPRSASCNTVNYLYQKS